MQRFTMLFVSQINELQQWKGKDQLLRSKIEQKRILGPDVGFWAGYFRALMHPCLLLSYLEHQGRKPEVEE
jgi:hypothetical protein